MEKCKNWQLIKNQILVVWKTFYVLVPPGGYLGASLPCSKRKKKLKNDRGTWKNAKIAH